MDKEKILEVLGNIIDINKEQLLKTSVDTKLTDLGFTSIQFIQFIVALEEEFEIEIPDDAAEKIKTVRDAVDYIEKQIQ